MVYKKGTEEERNIVIKDLNTVLRSKQVKFQTNYAGSYPEASTFFLPGGELRVRKLKNGKTNVTIVKR